MGKIVDLKALEKVLKSLANNRRLKILRVLKKEKRCSVGYIAEEIELSFKSTSRHLAVLYNADIVEKTQKGLEVYYYLKSNFKTGSIEVLTIL